MKYVLVILETDISSTDSLKRFANILQQSKVQIEYLNAGAYMLQLEDGLDAFRNILHESSIQKLPLRVLFFDSEPVWVYSTPK